MLKIGNLALPSPFILAPMSGVSDLSFRLLNRKFGCPLAFIEMLNVRSLGYKSRRTQEMLFTTPADQPLGVQILGKEPEFILRALDILQKYRFDILDFNAACPERKVTSRGEGASLLKSPEKLNKLLKVLVRHSSCPVTVKIRTGWDKDSVSSRDIALAAEDSGIAGLFIHGRTRMQGYSGPVDYAAIRQVKQALKIPVVASGDIFSASLARKMFSETGCDGVLIARGALGNPWIFTEAISFFKDGTLPERPQAAEISSIMTEHLNLCVRVHGARTGVIIFRKFFGWYVKGWRRIRILKEKAYRARREEEMLSVVEEFRVSHCLRPQMAVK